MKGNEIDKQRLMNAVLSSAGVSIDKESLKESVGNKNVRPLINKLTREEQKKLSEIMSDKAKLEAVIKSPQAQAIFKTFLKGGEKNG